MEYIDSIDPPKFNRFGRKIFGTFLKHTLKTKILMDLKILVDFFKNPFHHCL